MTDYLVTPNVRHLVVRVSEPETTPDARRYVWHALFRPICGAPAPLRSYRQTDWSHLNDHAMSDLLGPQELAKWRRALTRPICTDCAFTVANLRRLEQLGVRG